MTWNESTLKAILRRGGLGEHKVYDNVLVEATSSDPDDAAAFRRVLRVFDTLGNPPTTTSAQLAVLQNWP